MNSELQKSSIKYLLQTYGRQQAIGRVRSESLQEEMSLIGFIPYTVYYLHYEFATCIDLNEHLVVTPHYIRFGMNSPILPVFQTIVSTKGKTYQINKHLWVDPILDKIPNFILLKKHFTSPFNGSDLLQLMSIRWDDKAIFFERLDDGTYIYKGREEEWELSRDIDDNTFISNDFLCLCTFINKVTGMPNYMVIPSDDTIRVLPSTGDE